MRSDPIGSSEVEWAGRTASEVREVGAAEGSIAVIPVAAVEQHGPHLPTGTDTILVDAVATLGAERAAADGVPVLVTPAEWIGVSPHHAPLGGTVTSDVETLLPVLGEIADAAVENGFDAALFLNGHGGNDGLVSAATSTIGPEHHPDVEVFAATYFDLAAGFVDGIRESDRGGMGHGGEFETSLMLHLRPELVGEERSGTTTGFDLFGEGDAVSSFGTMAEATDEGIMGAPELATAGKGAELYDRLGDELAAELVDIHEGL